MRPLRYSINVTLDGCCDHRAGMPDEETHLHAMEGAGLSTHLDLTLVDRLEFSGGAVAMRCEPRATRPAE